MKPVPASEFVRNFGQYRMKAQREAIPVSSHGAIAGYFIRPEDYERLVHFKSLRRSFLTSELDEATVNEIANTRMDPRHDHLNALLEDDEGTIDRDRSAQ